MRENDHALLGERADSANRAAEGRQIAQFRLTTGDLWDPKHNRTTGSSCNPQGEPPNRRGSRAYVEQFRERIPLARAIRLKCGSCMGGEAGQMPRGEVAQAIDECGSCTCPLWPFRFGHDPWRPKLSEAKLAAVRRAREKARRCLEGQRRTAAESATGHSACAVSPSGPETA